MARVLTSQYVQGFLELVLFGLAMCGQVAACGTVVDKVMFGEEALGACVITGGEVYLGKEECIIGVAYDKSTSTRWRNHPYSTHR